MKLENLNRTLNLLLGKLPAWAITVVVVLKWLFTREGSSHSPIIRYKDDKAFDYWRACKNFLAEIEASDQTELARTYEETYSGAATSLELLYSVRYWLALNEIAGDDNSLKMSAKKLAENIDTVLGQPYTGPSREIYLKLLNELERWAADNDQKVLQDELFWDQRWFLVDGAKSGRKYEIHILGTGAYGEIGLELKKHKYYGAVDEWTVPLKDLYSTLTNTVERIRGLED